MNWMQPAVCSMLSFLIRKKNQNEIATYINFSVTGAFPFFIRTISDEGTASTTETRTITNR